MDAQSQPDPKFLRRQRQKIHLAAIWARLAGLTPGMTILDIGSGPGLLALEYARLASPGQVYALDPTTELTISAPNLTAIRQDATTPIRLPTPPDIIFLTDTLHHAANPAAILTALRATCGEKTNLFIAEYDPAQPGLIGAKTNRRLPPATVAKLLQNANFTIRAAHPSADEHYAILAMPAAPA